ncbi:MAG: gliding motility-associated C-terminal domain-containing protein [Bacteroidales bacterium]|nr:gliding motility-associated C-terminal domain-containing protein [Bacteroidales bacterium]
MNSKIIFISLLFLLLGIASYSQEIILNQTYTEVVTTCNATLYDSGGPNGDYSSNESYTITFCGVGNAPIIVEVISLRTESTTYDYIKLFNGTTATGSPIATLGGSSMPAQTEYEADGSCVTILWHSDGSVQYAGFELSIRCGFPCQDYTVNITPEAQYDETAQAYLGCSGGTVSAQLNFLHNNENYEQTIDNTSFSWVAISDAGTQTFVGMGLNELSEPLAPGAYFFTLTTTDANRCRVISNTVSVYISVPPTFTGTTITSVVCPGEDVELIGVVNPPDEWQMTIQEVNEERTCFDDDHIDSEQTSCFTYAAFAPGQTITSVNDIESIGMRMEHSYMGDLDIIIQCPSGQRMTLFEQSCGGTFFGEAVDTHTMGSNSCSDGDQYVGVGYDYYWTQTDNRGLMSANCSSVSILPAGNYQPVDDFSSLVGCPINGEWCVIFIDHLRQDDGTLFQTELHFADYLIPADDSIISFQNTYGDEMWWEGEAVQTEGNAANNIANPTVPGQMGYTFYATDNFGCTYDTTVYVTVRDFTDPSCCIEPTPSISSIPDLICSNRTNLSVRNIPNGNTGEWTVVAYPEGDDVNNSATFTSPNSPNTQVVINGWGTYTFRWTEYYMGRDDCTSFTEVTTTFRQQPTNSFVYTPIPCFGGETEVTYTGNMDETAEFTWEFGGAFVQYGATSLGPHILTWPEAGTHAISLRVNNDGCVTGDTVVSILNPERLVIDSISVADDPCYHSNGGSAIVTHHGGTLPISYSWAAPGTELLNIGVGNYSLIITDANGCTAQDVFRINEPDELVIISIETEDLTCYASHDGSISVSAGGGSGDLHYLWSDAGDGSADRINVSAGEYYLTVSDDHNCISTAYIAISQPERLVMQMTTDYAVCEGEPTPVHVTAFGGTAPYHYMWNSGNGEFEAGNEISSLLTTTTHYTAYVRDANDCVSDMHSMTVTVSPEMIIDSIMLRQIKCHGHCDGRAELVMRGGLPPLQYTWPSDTYIYDGICSGSYTLTVTDLIGCSVIGSFVITQPEDFVISTSMDSVSCYGASDGEARIFVDGATPPYTYLWPNGNTTDIFTTSAGSYIVTVHDSNGCRHTEEFNIPEPDPMSAIPINNVTICNGQSVVLTTQVTGGTPYYNYRWMGPDSVQYNGISYEVSPTVASTYYLTVYDSHGCSVELQPILIKINPDLRIASVVTSFDTICQGDEALIYVEADGGNGGPYTLTLQDGRVVPSPFTVRPDSTTMFYITLTDMCGTPSVTDSIEIFVHSYPDELFTSSNVEGCVPLSVTFTPLNINGTQYLWTFGDNDFSEEEDPTHVYKNPGDYDVTMTVWSEFGCRIQKTVPDMVHAYPTPRALFDAEVQSVSVLSPEVLFNNRSIDANRYFWFFGDQDSSTYESPRHMYPEMGEYEVVLVAESDHHCKDTTSRAIIVYSQFSFYAPTSFTPNGDGLNDCFRVCGNGISKNNFLFTVYDRWGELVFRTTEYFPAASCDACSEGSWDGTDWGSKKKGDKVLENGIYFWYCQFEDIYGIQHKEQGHVNMVR